MSMKSYLHVDRSNNRSNKLNKLLSYSKRTIGKILCKIRPRSYKHWKIVYQSHVQHKSVTIKGDLSVDLVNMNHNSRVLHSIALESNRRGGKGRAETTLTKPRHSKAKKLNGYANLETTLCLQKSRFLTR